jgi:hypothetical protein
LLLLRGFDTIPGAREIYERMRREGLQQHEVDAARSLQRVVQGEGTKLDYLPRRDYREFAGRLIRGSVLREHATMSAWQLRERVAKNWFVQQDPFVWHVRRALDQVRAGFADWRHLNEAPPERPYVFYPLHFEPEATTLVHGSYAQNQLDLVRNLARSLPAGWELVVKEHFFMRGRRSLSFYRRLQSTPGVRTVSLSQPTNQLIMGAQVVATIVSTAGLEASLIGKPVIMFGDYPWGYGPSIVKVGALSDLPELIRGAGSSELGIDHPDVLAFAASWDAALPPGRCFKTRQFDWTEPDNVARIAAALEGVMERAWSRALESAI